jgi:RNA polymerase sigma-70 factor (ECF subfamily)
MAHVSSPDVTQLLLSWSDGDSKALEQLVPLVSKELRHLAHAYMRRERPGHLLQTTALVDEAYLRLVDARSLKWQDRAHFYAISAKLMRQILVEFARAEHSQKRGGGVVPVSLEETAVVSKAPDSNLLALDEALNDLARFDARKARIVEMRFFGGLSVEETAEVLKISPITVIREWNKAKAWLYQAVARDGRGEIKGKVGEDRE